MNTRLIFFYNQTLKNKKTKENTLVVVYQCLYFIVFLIFSDLKFGQLVRQNNTFENVTPQLKMNIG